MTRPIGRRAALLVAGLFFPALFGCGGTATLTGTVKYAGKEIQQGKITFLPADDKDKTGAVGCDIKDGKYTARDVPLGKKRVYVTAQDTDAGQAETDMFLELVDKKPGSERKLTPPLLPPEATRDLTVDITQTGVQPHDFDLAKPGPKP